MNGTTLNLKLGAFRKIIITEKKECCLFCIHNPVGVKRLKRFRLQLGHLNEHRFRHGLKD